MTHLRTFATTLLALAAFSATAAFAQTATSTSEATITAVNELTITSGGTVTLAPALGSAATAEPTALAYETNDGVTYNIVLSVDGTGWAFMDPDGTSLVNTYPLLTVDAVTTDAGAIATGTLIDTANVATPVTVVSNLVNVKGTASVTLGASITETVVAGTYDASLTYTWTAQ
jgi:hypothetical protein